MLYNYVKLNKKFKFICIYIPRHYNYIHCCHIVVFAVIIIITIIVVQAMKEFDEADDLLLLKKNACWSG